MSAKELAAGRKMDVLIAERVMGWKRYTAIRHGKRCVVLVPDTQALYNYFIRSQGDPGQWEETQEPLTEGGTHLVPRYSADIKAAWQVVEHVCARTHHYELVYRPTGAVANFAGTERFDGYGLFDECGNSREQAQCIAICRAALLALGSPEAGEERTGE